MCLLHFWHSQASFWEPIGLSWGLLFGMLEGPVERLGHPVGPKWSKKHQDEGHKSDLAQVEVARGLRGSQWIDFGKMFITCSMLFGSLVCVFSKKGFMHHGCSVALQLLS